jgi:hypothetical protein
MLSASRGVRSALGILSLGVFGLGALVSACDGQRIADTDCGVIPDGGCPATLGVDACTDRECASTWRCVETNTEAVTGVWQQVAVCPAREAGTDAASDSGADAGADVSVSDASRFDGTLPDGAGGGGTCPVLEAPDCPLALAAGCPSGCCGCEDLFVCTSSGWDAWGYCADGTLHQAP